LLTLAGPAAPAPKSATTPAITNSIGMKLVRIPSRRFVMDMPTSVYPRKSIEIKRRVMPIPRNFWLGVHDGAQKQFKTVMGFNPSAFSSNGKGKAGEEYPHQPAGYKDIVAGTSTDDFPVENVSWIDAVDFCKNLSKLPAEERAGRTYRLPSEAEWEY